jgi:hypothetical protein
MSDLLTRVREFVALRPAAAVALVLAVVLVLAAAVVGVSFALNSGDETPAPSVSATTEPAPLPTEEPPASTLDTEDAEALIDAGQAAVAEGDVEKAKAIYTDAVEQYTSAGNAEGVEFANELLDYLETTPAAVDEGYAPVEGGDVQTCEATDITDLANGCQ